MTRRINDAPKFTPVFQTTPGRKNATRSGTGSSCSRIPSTTETKATVGESTRSSGAWRMLPTERFRVLVEPDAGASAPRIAANKTSVTTTRLPWLRLDRDFTAALHSPRRCGSRFRAGPATLKLRAGQSTCQATRPNPAPPTGPARKGGRRGRAVRPATLGTAHE